MSIRNNFPTIRPSLNLDFANVKALDPRITFTRTTTATYYDGYSTAKAEENLLLQSQEFDNAAWTKSNTAISGTNTVVAPDGTTTAEEVRDGTATQIHNVFQQLTITSGVTYVWSCFLKNVDRQYAILAASTGASQYASAKFDLDAGTAGSTQAVGGGWSVTSSSITSVGNDWYRCVLVFVPGNSGTGTIRIGMATDDTTFTASGSGLENYTGTDLKIAMWGAQLEQRSAVTAYTPTTTQPITNYVPVLQTAASGVARFDHNPLTGESLGLLVEEQRTNLLTYSNDFSNAAWLVSGTTLTGNIAVGPSGQITAGLATNTTTNSTHAFASRNNYAIVANTTHTYSVYLKDGGARYVVVRANNGADTDGASVCVDLVSGTLTAVSQNGTATGSTATIQAVGNGWYRVSLTVLVDAVSTSMDIRHFITESFSTALANYAGLESQTVYIWGAQLEAGAFPTSYIPTVAATVTRNADVARMTGTNFSSWYRADEGTVYSEHDYLTTGVSNQCAFSIDNGTGSEVIINASTTPAIDRIVVNSGGASQVASFGNFTFSANQVIKRTVAVKFNDAATVANNSNVSTDSVFVMPSPTQLVIGSAGYFSSSRLNGHIRKIAYYPSRLSDAQLQALTTV